MLAIICNRNMSIKGRACIFEIIPCNICQIMRNHEASICDAIREVNAKVTPWIVSHCEEAAAKEDVKLESYLEIEYVARSVLDGNICAEVKSVSSQAERIMIPKLFFYLTLYGLAPLMCVKSDTEFLSIVKIKAVVIFSQHKRFESNLS